MYVPPHFAESRLDVMQDFMRERPFVTLVTLSAGAIEANHIPLEYLPDPAPLGTLRGHVARANPMWRDLAAGSEALAIFQGPHAYITPSWYPQKREDGKVLPTWNYIVVHAYGALRVVDDTAWLRTQLEMLTATHETSSAEPWAIDDAPREFFETRIGGIVGIEMALTRLVGKWKLSQNQPVRNRAGIVRGLRTRADRDDLEMAALVQAAGRDGD